MAVSENKESVYRTKHEHTPSSAGGVISSLFVIFFIKKDEEVATAQCTLMDHASLELSARSVQRTNMGMFFYSDVL